VPASTAPPEPERSGFRYRTITGDVSRTYIEWGWRGAAAADAETPALDLLAIVLGQGRASRLYREVREPGHALSVSAGNFASRDIGVFGMSAEARPGEAARTLQALADTVQRTLRDGVHAEEIERARTLLGARLMRRLETAEGHAAFLTEWQALGNWQLGERYLETAAAVDEERVNELARTLLVPERATALVYGPVDADGRAQEDVARDLFGHGVPSGSAPAPPPRVEVALGSATFEDAEDGVRFYRAGGVRIAVQQRPGTGLASVAIALAGGSVHETSGQAGLTSLMMRVSPKGTALRDADAIALASEVLGGGVQAHTDADLFEWSMTVPAAEINTALALLAEVAFMPVFPDEAVERERRIALDDVAQVRDDMHRFPLSLMLGAAFPEHAYGFPLETLEAALADVDRADMVSWHQQRVGGSEPWVVVVGDVDPDSVAAVAAASVPIVQRMHTRSQRAPTWPQARIEVHAEKERAQTAIAIGLPGPTRDDDDLFPLLLAATAVGGLGGRAFEELRSKRSLAYVVNLRPIARRAAGAFVGYIATSPDREDEARDALLAEMMRLVDVGVEVDELERARRYTLGAWDIRRQTSAALAADLVGALVIGRGLVELRTFRDHIRAVTAQDVREAAGRWLDPARAVIGVVRGRR
jgi:zinc protease